MKNSNAKMENRRVKQMLFKEQEDNKIEITLDAEERQLLIKALRHYSAYGKDDTYIIEQIGKMCEIMNALEIKPEE